MIVAFLFLYLLMLLLAIGVIIMWIFYLITLSQCLKQCAPHNQRMAPGEVWMVLIPLFGIVWHFIMIGRIADSLAAEFRTRGVQPAEDRPGYNTGLTALILLLVPFAGIVGLVFLGIYWKKMSEYKKQLERIPVPFNVVNPNPYPPYGQGYYQQPPHYPPYGNPNPPQQ
jgi:hypothetical protein